MCSRVWGDSVPLQYGRGTLKGMAGGELRLMVNQVRLLYYLWVWGVGQVLNFDFGRVFFFFFPIAFWIPNEWTYLYLACNRHLQAREQQTVSAEDQIVNIIPTGHMVTVMVSSLSPSCRAPVRWYVSELGQPHSNKTLFKIQEVDRIWPMGRSVRALI